MYNMCNGIYNEYSFETQTTMWYQEDFPCTASIFACEEEVSPLSGGQTINFIILDYSKII